MKITIFNRDFPTERRYNRKIDTPNPAFVPRIRDRVQVGYDPAPVVLNVIWDYDKNEVLVAVGTSTE